MTPTLKQLIAGIPGVKIKGKDNVAVQSMACDSRRVGPGSLFFALSGKQTDGHHYIDEAIDRGAVAIVCGQDCWVPPNVTMVRIENLRPAVAEIAARFYGHPEKSLQLTGLLGTSGKTVVSALLKYFWTNREKTGLLGTIHYAVGDRTLPAHRTTPEPIELFGLLSQMKEQKCRRAFLEISSHGIDQDRVHGLQFQMLALLNLTPEHLQYHGSLEQYVQLEAAFLYKQGAGIKTFIAGIDDPQVRAVLEGAPTELQAKALSFGLSPEAAFRAEDIRYSEKDTRFTLIWPEGRLKLVSPLLGEFNVQNTLAALACGYAEGLNPADMGAALLEFGGVRGRMERLEAGQPFNVLIDYMHTEAAYEKGLEMIRSLISGRLITLFGCGGNRDASIRPKITRLVAQNSDLAVATADNPRNERIESIFADMGRGNEAFTNLEFIEDRRGAIAYAMSLARPGDTVLIAGKGHEMFQEFEDCVVPFDDRAVAKDIIRNRQWQIE